MIFFSLTCRLCFEGEGFDMFFISRPNLASPFCFSTCVIIASNKILALTELSFILPIPASMRWVWIIQKDKGKIIKVQMYSKRLENKDRHFFDFWERFELHKIDFYTSLDEKICAGRRQTCSPFWPFPFGGLVFLRRQPSACMVHVMPFSRHFVVAHVGFRDGRSKL